MLRQQMARWKLGSEFAIYNPGGSPDTGTVTGMMLGLPIFPAIPLRPPEQRRGHCHGKTRAGFGFWCNLRSLTAVSCVVVRSKLERSVRSKLE
jgi:hypothetical protein